MVLRTFLKSKIHGATVTGADVHYVGSIEIDRDLMDLSGLDAGEQVHIWDVTNAARVETYVIEAPRGSKRIAVNGAAAKLVSVGDTVIIAAFALTDEKITPQIVIFDKNNLPIEPDPAVLR